MSDDTITRMPASIASGTFCASGAGLRVHYAVRDPLVADLLATARQIFNNHLVGTQNLVRQLREERHGRAAMRT